MEKTRIHMKIQLLLKAQEYIDEAMELITEAVEDTRHERGVKHYMIKHLHNWAYGTDNLDTTCAKLINKFQQELEEL